MAQNNANNNKFTWAPWMTHVSYSLVTLLLIVAVVVKCNGEKTAEQELEKTTQLNKDLSKEAKKRKADIDKLIGDLDNCKGERNNYLNETIDLSAQLDSLNNSISVRDSIIAVRDSLLNECGKKKPAAKPVAKPVAKPAAEKKKAADNGASNKSGGNSNHTSVRTSTERQIVREQVGGGTVNINAGANVGTIYGDVYVETTSDGVVKKVRFENGTTTVRDTTAAVVQKPSGTNTQILRAPMVEFKTTTVTTEGNQR
jgi:hypothetical protein